MAVILDPLGLSSGRNYELARRSIITCDDPDRRDVLCGGGAAAFSVLLAGLLGGSSPARAEALAGPVPELDAVSVRVVIDSYQFAVAPSSQSGKPGHRALRLGYQPGSSARPDGRQ